MLGTGNIRKQIFDFCGTGEQANLFQGNKGTGTPPGRTSYVIVSFPDHLLEPDFFFVARIPQFFKQDFPPILLTALPWFGGLIRTGDFIFE